MILPADGTCRQSIAGVENAGDDGHSHTDWPVGLEWPLLHYSAGMSIAYGDCRFELE